MRAGSSKKITPKLETATSKVPLHSDVRVRVRVRVRVTNPTRTRSRSRTPTPTLPLSLTWRQRRAIGDDGGELGDAGRALEAHLVSVSVRVRVRVRVTLISVTLTLVCKRTSGDPPVLANPNPSRN